jgi:dTMP kinase
MKISKFFVVEGCSCSGKSTFCRLLKDEFEKLGYIVFLTKEPVNYDSDLENTKKGKDLLDVFVLDRKWHIENQINLELKNGKIVICDRYIPSSLVYQFLDGVPQKHIWALNKDFIKPDALIYLDTNLETLIDRMKVKDNKTRFEKGQFMKKEYLRYVKVMNFLTKKDWNIKKYSNYKNISEIVDDILETNLLTTQK